eukprot:jgi/Tetstr1/454050/TSEL_040969.t1
MHPLLFYSETCPHSQRIVNQLKHTADADKVLRLVCVDTQIDRIPADIDRVPALLVPTSSGNRVVFDTEMYEWLNSILRMDDSRRRSAPDAGLHAGRPGAPVAAMARPAQPDDFMPDSDAFLCDLGGEVDSAGHLFAGAGEEIRLNCVDGDDSGGRRGDDSSRDDDAINRMIAARNDEISSLYSQIARPV